MQSNSDQPYCLLIQKYAGKILDYTEGMDKGDFIKSKVTYDACILNFINLGEAVKMLSNEFKFENPSIPYRKIIGLRNIAAHSYKGLEPFRLFNVIVDDIPVLYKEISRVIDHHF